MKKESVVISVRISKEVYDMLCFIATDRREKYAKWLEEYGPVVCLAQDVSPNGVAKSLLVSAIGKEYVEVKNK